LRFSRKKSIFKRQKSQKFYNFPRFLIKITPIMGQIWCFFSREAIQRLRKSQNFSKKLRERMWKLTLFSVNFLGFKKRLWRNLRIWGWFSLEFKSLISIWYLLIRIFSLWRWMIASERCTLITISQLLIKWQSLFRELRWSMERYRIFSRSEMGQRSSMNILLARNQKIRRKMEILTVWSS